MKFTEFAEKSNGEEPQSAIVYGPPKTGKTTLVAQLAKKYKLIWFDIERGAQTLLTVLPKEYWGNVEIIQIADSQNEPNAIKTLVKVFTKNQEHKLCDAHGIVSCMECTKNSAPFTKINLYALDTETVVVVDSLTQLSDSAMAHALGPVDELSKKKIEFDHYDRQGIHLKNILTAQTRLPCHKVFISHEEELSQEDGAKKVCPVGGTRNFSRKVARYFDHAIYTLIKNSSHRSFSASTANPRIQTGSRSGTDLAKLHDITELFLAKPEQFKFKSQIEPPKSMSKDDNGGAVAKNPLLEKVAAAQAAAAAKSSNKG